MKRVTRIVLIVCTVLWVCCEDEAFESKEYPYVVSLTPEVSKDGVTLIADVLNAGKMRVVGYGFIVSKTETIDLAYALKIRDRKFRKGEYSFRLRSGLEEGETYRVRPFVQTETHTVFGDLVSFQSMGSLSPAITSFTPSEGPIGTSVVITGQNLGHVPALTTVKFGSVIAVVDSVTGDKLYTKVPVISEPMMVKITIETGGMLATSTVDFDIWFPWIRKASFPGTYLSSLTSFTVDGKIYVLGGLKLNPRAIINEFWAYDPASDLWTQLSAFPGSARFQAIAFTSNDKGYYGLGKDDSGYFRDLWEFDPGTGMWTQLKDYPGKTALEMRSFAAQGKGYVGLGYALPVGNNFTKEIWEYDPSADDWTQVADFAGSARYGGFALEVGQVGYLGMGDNGSVLKDIYAYNPTGNAWTLVTSYPGNGNNDIGSFYIGGKVYAGLGSNNSTTAYTDIWEFDPAKLSWKQMQPCPTKISPLMSTMIGDKGYVGLGWYDQVFANDENYGRYLYEFDPSKN